jgi:hypothetical protein
MRAVTPRRSPAGSPSGAGRVPRRTRSRRHHGHARHDEVHLLNRTSSEFVENGDAIAHDAEAILRAAAGGDPYDKRLADLIGELPTGSDEFRVPWAAHNVKIHRTGTKALHHPVVGTLALEYEAVELPGDSGQRILVDTAEPGSPSRQALDLLASWATTPAVAGREEP